MRKGTLVLLAATLARGAQGRPDADGPLRWLALKVHLRVTESAGVARKADDGLGVRGPQGPQGKPFRLEQFFRHLRFVNKKGRW